MSLSLSRPRLLVDVSVICKEDTKTGIQRVVRAIWLHLEARTLPHHDLVPVFATRRQPYRVAPADFLSQTVTEKDALADIGSGVQGDIFLGLDLCAHLLPRHRRQIARLRREGAIFAPVVYDLLPENHPDWFPKRMGRNFRSWLRLIAKEADKAICISQDVASELNSWLSGNPARGRRNDIGIEAIRLGGDLENTAASTGIPEGMASVIETIAHRPSLLVVGTVEPRKGHDVVLDAFEVLWRNQATPPMLIVVGKGGWKTEALQLRMRMMHSSNANFLWLNEASDELLDQFYDACDGVLVPSKGEGFGLPIVEALGRGRPVLARDLAVFRELSAPGLQFFRDDAPEVLAQRITEFLTGISQPDYHIHPTRDSWNATTDQIARIIGIS